MYILITAFQKALPRLFFNKNCVRPGCFSVTRVPAKLLLMKKIGFIFLFKWICHFLSEGKMMIQED